MPACYGINLNFFLDTSRWLVDDDSLSKLYSFGGLYTEVLILITLLYAINVRLIFKNRNASFFFPASAGILLLFTSGYIAMITYLYLAWVPAPISSIK